MSGLGGHGGGVGGGGGGDGGGGGSEGTGQGGACGSNLKFRGSLETSKGSLEKPKGSFEQHGEGVLGGNVREGEIEGTFRPPSQRRRLNDCNDKVAGTLGWGGSDARGEVRGAGYDREDGLGRNIGAGEHVAQGGGHGLTTDQPHPDSEMLAWFR